MRDARPSLLIAPAPPRPLLSPEEAERIVDTVRRYRAGELVLPGFNQPENLRSVQNEAVREALADASDPVLRAYGEHGSIKRTGKALGLSERVVRARLDAAGVGTVRGRPGKGEECT